MDTCNTVKQMKQTVAGRHHGMDTGQVSRDSIRFLSRYELVGFTFWASLAHFSEPTSLAGLSTWLILSCNDDFNCDYYNNDDWLTCQSTFGSDSPGREKWAICGTFFKFLTLYCDQTVGFFQVFSTVLKRLCPLDPKNTFVLVLAIFLDFWKFYVFGWKSNF